MSGRCQDTALRPVRPATRDVIRPGRRATRQAATHPGRRATRQAATHPARRAIRQVAIRPARRATRQEEGAATHLGRQATPKEVAIRLQGLVALRPQEPAPVNNILFVSRQSSQNHKEGRPRRPSL